jgi:hypothetical protein
MGFSGKELVREKSSYRKELVPVKLIVERGNIMSSDWLFDAVQVEVAYRNEQLRKAARSKWVGRADKAGRRLRARRAAGVAVPSQIRRDAGVVAATPERTR